MALARWTIGDVKGHGFDALRESVSQFACLYPFVSRHVFHNTLDERQVSLLDGVDATCWRQEDFLEELPVPPVQVFWKLCPPRMDMNQHEIVIDNDLILINRLPEIDAFLKGNFAVACEGRHRLFGKYDAHVAPGVKVNSGLYGLPPGLDLKSHVRRLTRLPIEYFDEQGIVAAAVTGINYKIIATDAITIIEEDEPLIVGTGGVHFVHMNTTPVHRGWDEYRKRKSLTI